MTNRALSPAKTAKLFEDVACEDGKFYLLKGQVALKAGMSTSAISDLKTALVNSSVIFSAEQLKRDGFYWIAKAYTSVYEKQKDDTSLRQAKSAWRMVENLLSNSPDHPYMIEAKRRLATAW